MTSLEPDKQRERDTGPSPGIGYIGALQPVAAWSRRTFSALSVRNYRLFFFGQGLSLIGTWMRRTALGWLVYELTGSMTLLGTVMALSLAPMFVVSPIAGALADRFDKRRILIFTQILACATSFAIAGLVFAELIEVWHLMALAVLGGVAFAVEVPTRQAFVVEMVGRNHLHNAIALNSAMVNGARIVGPAAAGLIMGTLGMATVFFLDALSYLVVTGTLIAMALAPWKKPVAHPPAIKALAEGLREVVSNPPVRLVIVMLFLTGCFGWAFQTLMPAIAQDLLLLGEKAYGALMAMFGVGAITGAIITASRGVSPGGNARVVFTGVWTMVVGVLLIACSRSFVTMSAALVLAGIGGVLFVSTGNTLVQLNVEDRIRGRVMGIWALAFGGALPVGSLLAGLTADKLAVLPLDEWLGTVLPAGLVAEFSGANSPFLTIFLFGTMLMALSVLIYALLGRYERVPSAPRTLEPAG